MNKSEYDSFNDDDDVVYSLDLNIDAIRALHSHLEYSIQMWPGAPRRPAEEQEFLQYLRSTMFTILLEHNFSNNEADRG